ncbi:MAG TPA: ATP-binding protein [Candidatus Didemnitutus sp.]|nr:ATP-binding protein [Candidatus Didemnitutus sp.]
MSERKRPSPSRAAARFAPGGQVALDWMQALVPHGVFTTDRHLRITSWNQWLVANSGIESEDAVGRHLVQLFPDLETRRLTERYARALEGEVSVLSVALHRYLLPFPSTVPESGYTHMLQSARISPLPAPGDGTVTIIEDVTQREYQAGILNRQQELDRLLSAALATLLQAHDPAAELNAIFASIRVALNLDIFASFFLTADDSQLRLNQATGLSPKQREALAHLTFGDADRRELLRPAPPSTLSVGGHGEMLADMGIHSRFSFPLAVGDRLHGLVVFGSYRQVSPTLADVGVLFRIARYVGIAIDRARREQETIAASRAKDDFLAALSHELRTPLNPVLLVASDAMANDEFPESAREAFRVIEKNVMLEARLIDDLLDLTRIAHGKLSLDFQGLSVHAVLRDAIGTTLTDIRDRDLNLRLQLSNSEPRVLGDPGRLQQVFWNILKNAVKFSPAGGQIEVTSAIESSGKEIVISVTDAGIGMDSTEISRVFSAFVQGDHAAIGTAHRFGGLGLGLAITRKLLELHSGSIEARSPGKGKGSTFVVRLPLMTPLAPATDASAAPRGGHGLPSSRAPFGASRRILLVEDHDVTRATLSRLLVRRGFQVTSVPSAAKACDAARHGSFDLVLSDIGLPDSDGFALMRKLRDEHGLKGIALTGYGMEEDLAKSSDAGFFAHLTKPISASVLDRSLEKAFLQQ